MYLLNALFILSIGVSFARGVTIGNQNQSYIQVVSKNQARLITGGTVVTDRKNFPYHASVQSIEGNIHLCSASLIDKQNLLTSAYCLHVAASDDINDDSINLVDASELQVVLGSTRLGESSDNVVTIPLKYIFIHEEWSAENRVNDVAVIRLAEEITETDYVKSIGFATSSPAVGDKCVSSGWSLLASSDFNADLRQVSFSTLADTACDASTDAVNEDEFCGLSDDGYSCQGELGSPVICNDVQAGIASIYTCISNAGPITNVAYHSDWIKEQQNRSGSMSLMSSVYMLCFCIYASIYSYRNW